MHSQSLARKRLRVADVADRLDVSRDAVYRLIHAGDLAALRIGGSLQVEPQAVDRYLADAAVPAAAGIDGGAN